MTDNQLTDPQLYVAANEFYAAACGTIGMFDESALTDIAEKLNLTLEDLQDNVKFWEDVRQQMFSCESCGWWCDASEEYENDTCDDCSEENEE